MRIPTRHIVLPVYPSIEVYVLLKVSANKLPSHFRTQTTFALPLLYIVPIKATDKIEDFNLISFVLHIFAILPKALLLLLVYKFLKCVFLNYITHE